MKELYRKHLFTDGYHSPAHWACWQYNSQAGFSKCMPLNSRLNAALRKALRYLSGLGASRD
jgi:hypothetical protein